MKAFPDGLTKRGIDFQYQLRVFDNYVGHLAHHLGPAEGYSPFAIQAFSVSYQARSDNGVNPAWGNDPVIRLTPVL